MISFARQDWSLPPRDSVILINLNEEQFLTQCTKYNVICNNLFGPINVNDATNEFIRIMK